MDTLRSRFNKNLAFGLLVFSAPVFAATYLFLSDVLVDHVRAIIISAAVGVIPYAYYVFNKLALAGRSQADSSSLASMERRLSSEVETLRGETERRLQPIEERLNAAVDEVKSVAERIVQERVNQEIGENVLEGIGKRILEQTSDYARKEKLKRDIVDAFNNSSTRIKAHA